ncbi:GNAT family N-acetyltransferase [Sphingomonas sp. STIS6.2]|uniref:GNAT family N-acetyltransferase n=1 Tax=Sphingomonas sp. STIS6.2 TaxID=1379700 RepID=UPI0018FE5C69|nr:GNAT family N-acetyltransferase [Sphingomonas sp. STIS6.2]
MIFDPLPSVARPASPSPLELSAAEAQALSFLLPLSNDYPGIAQWFSQKVVPGARQGTRLLLPIERDGEVVGLGIAKKETDERKICTVRVASSHVGRGIGVRLFDGLLKWLDDDRPHLTVSATKLPQFERIFDYYGFNVTSANEGLYVPRMTELGYNEPMTLPIAKPIISNGINVLPTEFHPA